MDGQQLPSPSECALVQEALSIKYVDKIGLAWLPSGNCWAIFSNSGKLVEIRPSLNEAELRTLCAGQDREWRQRMDQELERRRPVIPGETIKAIVALGDLDL